MPEQITRRAFLTFAAVAAGTVSAIPAMSQTTPAPAPNAASSSPTPVPAPTEEGKALYSAALASAGFALPPADDAEVRKQISSYPAGFKAARALHLENGDAPAFGVTSGAMNRL